MNLLFVVNPISGGVDKEPFLREAEALCTKYNIDFKIFKTTGSDDEQALKHHISGNRPDKIAVVGGDGTVRFAAVSLLESNLPLGIIPLGSANGLATDFGVPLKPIDALRDIIMSEFTMHIDIVRINDQYYSMHLGDVGINAGIVSKYSDSAHRGMVTYAKYFVEEVSSKHPFDVQVETDKDAYGGKVLMVAICNARKFGTGVPLNLTGTPTDGKFELVLLERFDVPGMIKAGLSKFNERFLDTHASKVFEARRATIHFAEPRTLQLDGEVIAFKKRLDKYMDSAGSW